MKTVFIYGAPGVGKYTVAKELARLSGFGLIHNHLLNDLVMTVFKFGTKGYGLAVRKYRLDLMERAAQVKKKGIILTYVYGKTIDNVSLKQIVSQARKHRGSIVFVHLVCDKDKLLKRIKDPSRANFGKIRTIKTFNDIIKRRNIFAEVPYKPNLIIDNTNLSPFKAAKLIQKQYRIPDF